MSYTSMVKVQRPPARGRSPRGDRSASHARNSAMIWSVLQRKLESLADSARRNKKQNIPRPDNDRYGLREAFIPKEGYAFVVGDFCLAAGTLIDTPTGNIPIEDIAVGTLVYTYNHSTNLPDCSHVTAKKRTGIRPTMSVVLDNGERVRCTKAHRWLLADGSEIEASKLRVGDRLLPLRRSYAGPMKYETLYSRSALEYVYTHKMVSSADKGPTPPNHHVHHVDGSTTNNNPSNLKIVTAKEHSQLHADSTVRQWKRPKVRAKTIKGISESIAARGGYNGHRNPNYGNFKGTSCVCEGCNKHFYRPPCRKAKYCSTKCYWAAKRGSADLNHKIIAIEHDGIYVETWDIEVSRDHNFALSAGVFVHNCQLEMRILAHMSEEKNMQDVINSGKDIHAGTACLMYNHDYDALNAALKRKKMSGSDKSIVLTQAEKDMIFHRQAAKAIGFGLNYGEGPKALAKNTLRRIQRSVSTSHVSTGSFEPTTWLKRY